jgi:hypothetical protein
MTTNPSFIIGSSIGHDMYGQPVRLGDTDCYGYTVGWINPDTGDCYESFYEFLSCQAAGQYTDAMRAWRQGHGTRPRPHTIVDSLVARYGITEYREALINDAIEAEAFWRRLKL